MIDEMPPAKWDEETDIIIVGSGFAGLAAAIEARKASSTTLCCSTKPRFWSSMKAAT